MTPKVTAFIGSSSEGLPVAQTIKRGLARIADCEIWNENTFELGRSTLQSLVDCTHQYEFAIFVLTPDDSVLVRGSQVMLPRDNVLFELGLFMGALGPDHVFAVHCNDSQTKLLTDFNDIETARL